MRLIWWLQNRRIVVYGCIVGVGQRKLGNDEIKEKSDFAVGSVADDSDVQ